MPSPIRHYLLFSFPDRKSTDAFRLWLSNSKLAPDSRSRDLSVEVVFPSEQQMSNGTARRQMFERVFRHAVEVCGSLLDVGLRIEGRHEIAEIVKSFGGFRPIDPDDP